MLGQGRRQAVVGEAERHGRGVQGFGRRAECAAVPFSTAMGCRFRGLEEVAEKRGEEGKKGKGEGMVRAAHISNPIG